MDVREPWREEKREPGYDPAQPILRSRAADGGGNVLHSEKGEVSCRCPAAGTVRPMAFQGFEADRGSRRSPSKCGLGTGRCQPNRSRREFERLMAPFDPQR